MSGAQANFSAEGDPRLSNAGIENPLVRPQDRPIHDHTVSFEEYFYYAAKTRAEEDSLPDIPTRGIKDIIFPPKSGPGAISVPESAEKSDGSPGAADEKSAKRRFSRGSTVAISDEEWMNASRAMRTATWAAAFYLITTDILGPFNAPFAIGTLGWGPGVSLYTVFGFLAGYSGYLLWQMFLGLDSYQYPLRTYGDLAFRLYGRFARHSFNFLQSVQLLCNVGIIVISNGQALSQVSKFRLCYAVCCLIWAICGFFLGQVRTLQKYGWLANVAIWMNLLIIFISMGVIANSAPNYNIAAYGSAGAVTVPDDITPVNGVYPPVKHYGDLPNPGNFDGAIVGLMQGVYAYGGAMLFTEFMSEMRRPRDFIKGMWAAQFFIWSVYMIYGLCIYWWQGQYAYSISYQGVSIYGWQTVGNMLAVFSGLIAAGLYGNIGIKVLYNNVLVDFFNAPPLTVKSGKIAWAIIVPIYWTIAFIFAAAIPDFSGLTSMVAACCIMQFTYTFPPLLSIGYNMKKYALAEGEGFDPATGRVTRHKTGISRWVKAFFSGPWYMNVFNVIYMLGSLATAGLGAYSACMNLIDAFESGQANAFTCASPVNYSS
ncbi:putative amino acid transporter [Phaeomoniella chlamydospora]|uniref:Putative amino acid transporter n=1 Tax=Phaeomoniella chlamydospora TaxID=158046 RepID=A0A0G2F316_PHACM|nr:putative amino acid transporter [Phaeomoniella chlamydospora]